jgi:proliferating cell nuclear antigen PCNA
MSSSSPPAPSPWLVQSRHKHGKLFREMVLRLSKIVNEANLYWLETGLEIETMDSAHIALVLAQFPKQYWDLYNSRVGGGCVTGLHFYNFHSFLKLGPKENIITFQHHQQDQDNLTVTQESYDGIYMTHLEMKLMNIESERISLTSEIEERFKVKIVIPASFMLKIIDSLKTLDCDTVRIAVSKEGLKVSGVSSNQEQSGSVTLKPEAAKGEPDYVAITSLDPKAPVLSMYNEYSLSYLKKFLDTPGEDDFISLRMGPDIPMEIACDLIEKDDVIGSLKYYLSPKIRDPEPEE